MSNVEVVCEKSFSSMGCEIIVDDYRLVHSGKTQSTGSH